MSFSVSIIEAIPEIVGSYRMRGGRRDGASGPDRVGVSASPEAATRHACGRVHATGQGRRNDTAGEAGGSAAASGFTPDYPKLAGPEVPFPLQLRKKRRDGRRTALIEPPCQGRARVRRIAAAPASSGANALLRGEAGRQA